MSVQIRQTGLVVDLVLFRLYGRAGLSCVEQMLAGNPGLAELGPILPVGIIIGWVPDPPDSTTTVQSVDLFS